jgi:hypothetical protein
MELPQAPNVFTPTIVNVTGADGPCPAENDESEWIDVEQLNPDPFPCTQCKTTMAPFQFWQQVKKLNVACGSCEGKSKSFDAILKTLKRRLREWDDDGDSEECRENASKLFQMLTHRLTKN